MELQNTNIEPTYENFVMAYYSGDADAFFKFGQTLEKRVVNKYFRQLETEKKLLGE